MSTEIPVLKRATLRNLNSKLANLEVKKKTESTQFGRPNNSTLAKIYRLEAELNILEDDLENALKNIKQGCKYVDKSFIEAKKITDGDHKRTIMNKILEERKKYINDYTIIKLTKSNTLNLQNLNILFSEINDIFCQIQHQSSISIWIIIYESLNQRLKNVVISFSDNSKIVEHIDALIADNTNLSTTDTQSLQWTNIRILQSLVKEKRGKPNLTTQDYHDMANYRHSSAIRLNTLKQPTNAVDDKLEAYLYEILATKDQQEWTRLCHKYDRNIKNALKSNKGKSKYINTIYARIYLKGYVLSSNIDEKIKFILKVKEYSKTSNSKYKNNIILIQNSLYILKWLTSNKDVKYIQKEITNLHRTTTQSVFLKAIDLELANLYSSVVDIINGKYPNRPGLINNVSLLIKEELISLKYSLPIIAKILAKALQMDSTELISTVEETDNLENSKEFNNLQTILQNEESVDLEVKLSGEAQIDKITKTITAFANTKGGKIIIGLIEKEHFKERFPEEEIAKYTILARKFVVIGHNSFDNFRQKLASYINKHVDLYDIELNMLYSPSIINVGNKDVMVLDVLPIYKTKHILLSVDDYVYSRLDNHTTQSSPKEIIQKLRY